MERVNGDLSGAFCCKGKDRNAAVGGGANGTGNGDFRKRGNSESPLDCKEIQPANPKGNQSRIFIGRTDAEAEAPMLWPPDAKG